jgi:hypothetical protein
LLYCFASNCIVSCLFDISRLIIRYFLTVIFILALQVSIGKCTLPVRIRHYQCKYCMKSFDNRFRIHLRNIFGLEYAALRRMNAISSTFLRLRCRQSCLDRVGPLFFAAQLHFSARNYATIGRKPFSSHCRSFASKFCGFFASPVPSMLSRPCRTAVFCGPAASPVPSMLS